MIALDKLRFRMAESIFESVVALPPDQRASALERHCGSDAELRAFVERLLVSDAQPSTHDSEYRLFRAPIDQPPPQRIGGYRIIRPLGEGGMGVVFEAEQDHPRRSVALKMLRPGILSARSVERFEHEAELLGQLKHSGIAQVFEAGTVDVAAPGGAAARQPFFAMELVDGETLIEFARNRKLTIESRLELLLQVCEAVHHAHQKGVIHRDLKPGNILVNAEGHPKVLDFGVARMIGVEAQTEFTQTAAGQLVGTLAYMSPEQVSGKPITDTRSDVYSLGVVAFELLTGALPYDVANASVPGVIRTISDTEARLAGVVAPALRGDLEAILAKALEKDIERRYGSSADLAADIRRYLSHQPVYARSPTFAYQFSRFARRNRGLIAGVAVTALALVAGTIGTATFAWRESRQVERAEAQVARAESILRLLREMLASVDPRTRAAGAGADVTVREVLDETANRIQSGELADQPEVETALWRTICETYLNLGHYAEARLHLEKALVPVRARHGLENGDAIALLNLLGRSLDGLTLFAEAERSHREALSAAETLWGRDDLRIADLLNDLGVCQWRAGKFSEAQESHRRALALRQSNPEATPSELAESLTNLGVDLRDQAQFAEAETLLRRALELRRQHSPPDHLDLADTLNNLAGLLRRRDSLDEAESLMREALKIYRSKLDPTHPDLAKALHEMAMLVKRNGRAAEAVPLVRDALEIQLARLGPAHKDVAATRLSLAFLLNELGKIDEAESESLTALEIMRKTFGPRHQDYAYALHNVAIFRIQQDNAAGAEALLREAVDIIDECLTPMHDNAAHMRDSLAVSLIRQGSHDEAVRLLTQAVDVRRKLLGDRHGKVGLSLGHLAEARLRGGDAAGALEAVTEALSIVRPDPPGPADMGTMLLVHAEAAVKVGDPVDEPAVRDLIGQARKLYAERFGETSARTAETRRVEALLLVRLGRFEEAETMLTETLGALDSLKPPSLYQAQSRGRVVEALASLFREWGKPELAAQWSAAK